MNLKYKYIGKCQKTGILIGPYYLSEAAEKAHTFKSNILHNVNGQRRSAGGYVWTRHLINHYGVNQHRGKWFAWVGPDYNDQYWIGQYATQIEATEAFDAFVVKHNLNTILNNPAKRKEYETDPDSFINRRATKHKFTNRKKHGKAIEYITNG